jgi:rare lipoprotein A
MLPLPSYVEVTSLENGRTVLIRLTQRGPMTGDAEIALSPATAARIELSPGSPVRVRRVNPPEFERAQLRRGEMAAERIETPMGLVQVLLRKLPEAGTPQAEAAPAGPQSIEVPASAAMPSANPVEDLDTPPPADTPAQSATAEPEPAPPAPAVQGNLIVQAAAFSTQERAQKAAESLGGTVSQAGQYWRVRTGPFATQAEAQASLAKVKAAGYSDARIQTID